MPEARALSVLARRISQLPPLPEALRAVTRALQRDDLSAERCITLIESDPALAARTLRLANSAFYGASGQVNSIGDAVRMLGLRTVSGVLTAASMHALLPARACPGFDFMQYWRHAIATGWAARSLAACATQEPDEAFLAGLMHDIGQLVLIALQPGPAAAALALARDTGCSAAAAEQKVFGCTHARVGALVGEHWCLPAAVVQAIGGHHQADSAGGTPALNLCALIGVADTVADVLEQRREAHKGGAAAEVLAQAAIDALCSQAAHRLGLESAEIMRVLAVVEAGTREIGAIIATA
jgi:HD-like signal output (HDOD) protein